MCLRFVLTLQRMRVESLVFYRTISKRSCHVQHSKCNQNVAIHSMFMLLCSIYKNFKLLFHHYFVLKASIFYMGKVGTVCIRCVLTLHRICVESRVFYPTISQRSCHVQHSTCNQNVAIHSKFSYQEFQGAFSPLYCTVRQRIIHGKSG